MMNCLLMTLAVAASAPTPTETEVLWVDNYGAALEATRERQKPLLIVIDDSAQPKGQSQRVGAIQEKKNAELLDNYVRCHVDVTTDYGKRVADVFRVKNYPFMAIIDNTGEKIIYKKTGRLDDPDWVTALDTHKGGESRTAACGDNGSSSRYT